MNSRLAIFIVGPTGVGKTDVAIRVAGRLNTEIVSADSRQVYRELSIGTAVPSPGRLKTVRHHLLQHRSVREHYNAGMYETEALEVLERLFREHPAVVIAGGSGLYIRAICEGIDDIPSVEPEIRAGLRERLDREGLESLRFELRRLDPVSYRNIDLKNPKRILKALEITAMTGRPYSSFLTREKKKRDFRILKIGLNLDRDVLYRRIDRRVDEMMTRGLLDEARALFPLRDMNALNTVGYRELFAHFDGSLGLEEAVALIKRNTRRYARRQLTWFKGDPDIEWFPPGRVKEIMHYIAQHGPGSR